MRDNTGLFQLWNHFTTKGQPPENYMEVPTPNHPTNVTGKVVFIDFETTALSPAEGHTWCYWMAVWSPSDGWQYACESWSVIRPYPLPVLHRCIVIAFNVGFERSWLDYSGACTECLFMDVKSLVARTQETSSTIRLAEIAQKMIGVELDKNVRAEIIAAGGDSSKIDFSNMLRYCWEDVGAMLGLWSVVINEYNRLTPHPVSRFGQLLASTQKVPIADDWQDWVQGLEQVHSEWYKLAVDEIRAIAQQVASEVPSWLMSAPRKHDEKSAWLDKARVEYERSDFLQRFLGSDAEINSSTIAKVRSKLRGWVEAKSMGDEATDTEGEDVSLGDTFTCLMVNASWYTPHDEAYHPLRRCETGWYWIDEDGNHQALMDSNDKVVKGHTCLTQKVVMFDEAEEVIKPGIRINSTKLQSYLVRTAFYRSIRSRLASMTVIDGWAYPSTVTSGTFTGRGVDPFWLVLANPKPKKLASEVKTKVKAKPGHKLCRLDFSSQELRLAHYVNAAYGAQHWGWLPVYENNPHALAETSGVKSEGTDSHTLFAKKITEISGTKVSRDQSKNAAYACQYGVGARGLINQTGFSLAVAEATIEAYKGKKVCVFEAGDIVGLEFRGGVLSGYFSFADTLDSHSLRSLVYGRKPHLTRFEPNKLTMSNYPIQGTAVDMRDTLLVHLYCGIQDLGLVWQEVSTVYLHDEQVFHVPESMVDAFNYRLAEAHKYAWLKVAEAIIGSQDACPKAHYSLEGIECYSHWRKEVHMGCVTPTCNLPENWDNGYIWNHPDFQ